MDLLSSWAFLPLSAVEETKQARLRVYALYEAKQCNAQRSGGHVFLLLTACLSVRPSSKVVSHLHFDPLAGLTPLREA